MRLASRDLTRSLGTGSFADRMGVADGVFARIFVERAQPGPDGHTIMIDSTHLKARRRAASLSKGGSRPRAIGRTKAGLNSRLHMLCDGLGRPLTFFLSPGQMRDGRGAAAPLGELPPAKGLLADTGHDADWLREALRTRGSWHVSPPGAEGRSPPAPTGSSPSSATGSRTSLPASRTGGVSPPATTDAASCSFPPSAAGMRMFWL